MIEKGSDLKAFWYYRNMKLKRYLPILFIVVIANFIAQIPYYLHQYHTPPSTIGTLLLLAVLVWFLLGFTWVWQGKTKGYAVMIAFLITEFLFYLSTQITQAVSGKGILLHVMNPEDPVLFMVFGIGYINLIVSGIFIILLIIDRNKRSKYLR